MNDSLRRSHWSAETTEEANADYRSLCPWTAIALGAGLLSPLVFLHTGFVFLPAIGVLCGFLGLWRVAGNPDQLTGRPLALVGIALAFACVSARTTALYRYRATLRAEAIAVAADYIDFLRAGQPQMAHNMRIVPWQRRASSPDEVLREYYSGIDSIEDLVTYTSSPVVHALLLLGDRANIRLYGVDGIWSHGDGDRVELLFAATYDPDALISQEVDPVAEDGLAHVSKSDMVLRTFFFRVVLERRTRIHKDRHQAGWLVSSEARPVLPAGWNES